MGNSFTQAGSDFWERLKQHPLWSAATKAAQGAGSIVAGTAAAPIAVANDLSAGILNKANDALGVVTGRQFPGRFNQDTAPMAGNAIVGGYGNLLGAAKDVGSTALNAVGTVPVDRWTGKPPAPPANAPDKPINALAQPTNAQTSPGDAQQTFLNSLNKENPRLGYFAANNPTFWQAHGNDINAAGGDINKLRGVVDKWGSWINGAQSNPQGTPATNPATPINPAAQNPALAARQRLGNPQVENIAGTKVSTVGFNQAGSNMPADEFRTFALSSEPGAVSGAGRTTQINPNNAGQMSEYNRRAMDTSDMRRVDDLTPAEQRVRNVLNMASNELAQFTTMKPKEKAALLMQAMGPAMSAGGHLGGAEIQKEGNIEGHKIAADASITGHRISSGTARANALTQAEVERGKFKALLEGKAIAGSGKNDFDEFMKKEIAKDALAKTNHLDPRVQEEGRTTLKNMTGKPGDAANPTWEQFYQKAATAPQNKGKTKQQLLDYYNQNYR